MASRPLAKALHTVTVVARVADTLARANRRNGAPACGADDRLYCADALFALGYEDEALLVVERGELSPLLEACLAAVARAVMPQPSALLDGDAT